MDEAYDQNHDDIIKVLIADDHKLISEALRSTLNDNRGFQVELVSSLSSTIDALRPTARPFDIILLDISMPGMLGLRSVKRVVEAAGPGAVVIFSGTVEPEFVWQAITLGAKGYVAKDQPLRSLPSTLRLIADGHEFVPMSISQHKLDASKGTAQLTQSDRLILKSVAEGKTNKEIALELQASEVAIKMKMRSICNRLEARNRAHAVIVASQKGII